MKKKSPMTRKSIRWLAMLAGIIAGAVFFVFQLGIFRDVIGSGTIDYLIDWVTFCAPILTFTIAVAACFEQVMLHGSLARERRGAGIALWNLATVLFVGLACSSLVRLDVAAVKSRLERKTETSISSQNPPAAGVVRNANAPAEGPRKQPSTAADTQPLSPVISPAPNISNTVTQVQPSREDSLEKLLTVGGKTMRHLISLNRSTDLYDPCTHLAITLILFGWFCAWDGVMLGLSLDAGVKREIKAVTLALNWPTLLGLSGMFLLAVFALGGLSQAEQQSFIGGIIAFHLAFAAFAYLISVIIQTSTEPTPVGSAPDTIPQATDKS